MPPPFGGKIAPLKIRSLIAFVKIFVKGKKPVWGTIVPSLSRKRPPYILRPFRKRCLGRYYPCPSKKREFPYGHRPSREVSMDYLEPQPEGRGGSSSQETLNPRIIPLLLPPGRLHVIGRLELQRENDHLLPARLPLNHGHHVSAL